MNTYMLIDLALRLVSAGVNAATLVEDVREREEAGADADEIHSYLSEQLDAWLEK